MDNEDKLFTIRRTKHLSDTQPGSGPTQTNKQLIINTKPQQGCLTPKHTGTLLGPAADE